MEASFSGGFVFNTQAEMEVRIADGSPSSTESITFPVLGIQDGGIVAFVAAGGISRATTTFELADDQSFDSTDIAPNVVPSSSGETVHHISNWLPGLISCYVVLIILLCLLCFTPSI